MWGLFYGFQSRIEPCQDQLFYHLGVMVRGTPVEGNEKSWRCSDPGVHSQDGESKLNEGLSEFCQWRHYRDPSTVVDVRAKEFVVLLAIATTLWLCHENVSEREFYLGPRPRSIRYS